MPYDDYGQWYEDTSTVDYTDPAMAPPNSYWDAEAGKWVSMKPGDEGYDPTYGGYTTGNPWGESAGDQWLKSVYEHQGWTLPPKPGETTPGGGGDGDGKTGGTDTLAYQRYGMNPQMNEPLSPDLSWFRNAPAFTFQNPYGDFNYADFKAPGAEGMYADPGYQFRLDEGRKALEASAAARGVTRSGGNLTDILKYGQQMASAEYGNTFNRAMQSYGVNRTNAKDAYDTNYGNAYQRAMDAYSPQLMSWQTEMAAKQGAANRAFDRAWDAYSYATPSATTIFNAGNQ
ncbi:MAG: hypothetical protein VW405_01015 [Rhodospirillaceae bacterium]